MILTLLIAAASQYGPDENMPLALKQVDVPIMGGMRENVLGVKDIKTTATLGLYIDNYNKMWDDMGEAPVNFVTPRIGTVATTIKPAILGSTECLEIDTSSTRTQTLKTSFNPVPLHLRLARDWWVTPEGKILAESFRFEVAGNVWTMDAKYDAETYTVTLSSPDRGKRTMGPITPYMGMDDLTTTAFKPMIQVPDKVVLEEKTFYMLDPFTGAPVKYQAKVKGTFAGIWSDTKFTGHDVEITGGPDKAKLSISKEGWLLRAVLEQYKYLHLIEKPTKDGV